MDQSHRTDAGISAKDVPSAALARLIAEITGPAVKASAERYNRTYNRHNR